MMKERVLITGASGFVGYHLIEAALRHGMDVFAAVRPTSNIDHLWTKPVRFTFTDFSNLDNACNDINTHRYTHIIHAAGAVRAANEKTYNNVNAGFTKTLALAAKASGSIEKFVFISSLAAVGPVPHGEEITAHTQPRPITAYGKSKLLAESYLASVGALSTIVLRPTAVYGPRERDIFMMFKGINQGIEPYIAKADQKLSFIYVKDLADAAVTALTSKISGRTYNVADGYNYGRNDLATETKSILKKKTLSFQVPLSLMAGVATVQELFGAMTGKIPVLNRDKLKELTAQSWACNIDAMRTDLGYNPRYTLRTGLAETLAWYKEQGWL